MNGIHDMGGMDGFGPVRREDDEPVFHADWERRMFGLAATIPFTVAFSDDHLRREIERIPPADYLAASYYELWFRSIHSLLIERGVLRDGELEDPASVEAHAGAANPLPAVKVREAIREGVATRMPEVQAEPRFVAGDVVLARNMHPTGHTRLPRYVRGRRGTVIRNHGIFRFPDSGARDAGPDPQHVYTVEFSARELWGDDAPETDSLCLELWESYLERP